MRARQFNNRASFARSTLTVDGVSSPTVYAQAVPCMATPLPPAVSPDPQAPISKSGFTLLLVHRGDVRIGDLVGLTLASGDVFPLKVTRVSVVLRKRRHYSEVRAEDDPTDA